MLIKGDPDGAKSLPEQNVDSSSLESIPENFTENVQAMLTNFSFEIHILDSFMNLPCDNELTG